MFLSTNLFGLPIAVWLAIVAILVGLTFAILNRRLNTREVSVIAVLASACIVSNYALIWLPNVKVMDLIVFVSGLRFGAYAGGLVGVLVWAIYGSINPYGFILPIWMGCMASESVFGIVGGVIGNHLSAAHRNRREFSLEMGATGFLLSFFYDLVTNVLSAVTVSWFETSPQRILAVLVSGIPFAVIHEFSNGVLFFLGVVPLDTSIRKLIGDRSKFAT